MVLRLKNEFKEEVMLELDTIPEDFDYIYLKANNNIIGRFHRENQEFHLYEDKLFKVGIKLV